MSSWAEGVRRQQEQQQLRLGGTGPVKPVNPFAMQDDDECGGNDSDFLLGGKNDADLLEAERQAEIDAAIPKKPLVISDEIDGISKLQKLLRGNMLVKTKDELEVLRNDPNNPLHSVQSFEELSLKEELLKAIHEMGFRFPSKIQETALPTLISGKNMIAQSQSGTGKTAAFALTILSRIDADKHHPQAIVISPTYELTTQIADVITEMAKFMPSVEIELAVRQARSTEQIKAREPINAQVIVGTPGKLFDYIEKYKIVSLKDIRVLVLDEADVMISGQGHQQISCRLKDAITQGAETKCQMLLFSATYDEEIRKFATEMVPDADIIRLKREEQMLDSIKQYQVVCSNDDEKFKAICTIYSCVNIGQAIFFCATRRGATDLTQRLVKNGHTVGILSGELAIEQRQDIINRFRNGKERVLVCTNVCSRGLDIRQVTLVVNYDLPVDRDGRPDFETYIHRIGRTGRFGSNGIAINFVAKENDRVILSIISKYFRCEMPILNTEDEEVMNAFHDADDGW